MSIVSAPTSLTVTTTERTWRATIETPFGASCSLSIHREQRMADNDDTPIGNAVVLPGITLPIAAIQNETITLAGVTHTVAELMAFLEAYFDQKAIAFEAARVAAEAAAAAAEKAAEAAALAAAIAAAETATAAKATEETTAEERLRKLLPESST